MAEKVTTMVLNVVDLQCSKCYKKIKKILCKFPEIRDQKYDEKANKVTITVVCCSPEKIRDKLCCKGCGCIKSIEIIEPKQDGKQKQDGKPKQDGKQKQDGKPKQDGKAPPGGKDKTVKVSVDLQFQGFCYCKCCCGRPRGPCSCGGQGPCSCGMGPCSCGWRGPCSCGGQGPCSCGGRGQCHLYYGRPVCDSWCAYGSGCEETQQGCSIM